MSAPDRDGSLRPLVGCQPRGRQVLEQDPRSTFVAEDLADLGLGEPFVQHGLGEGGELARVEADGGAAVVVRAEGGVVGADEADDVGDAAGDVGGGGAADGPFPVADADDATARG